ncbi:hypothetical protein D917_07661, partial [Trichinella nativa]
MIHVRLPGSNPTSFSGQSSALSTASSLRVGAGAKVNIRCSVPNQNILMPKGALIQLHAGKLCIPIRPVPPPASTANDDFNVAAESKKIALRSGTTVGGGSKRRRSAAVVASTSSKSDSSKLRRSTRSSFKAAVEKNSNIFAPSTHSDDHHYNNEDEGEELPSRSGDVERMDGTSTQGTVSFDPEAETSLEKAILKLLNKQVNDLWSEITLSKAETKLRIQNNLINQNRERCLARPMYGSDLRMAFTIEKRSVPLSRTLEDIFQSVRFLLQQFLVYVPAALISEPLFRPTYRSCAVEYAEVAMRTSMNRLLKNKLDVFRAVEYAQRLCFPELRLIEYDC